MVIGIDARFYGPIGKGLGRYVQEVVDNIIKISGAESGAGDFSYVIFLGPDNFDEFTLSGPKIKKVKINCSWYGWREQLLLPFYIWREKLDLMHFPHFNVPILTTVGFVVTIHDLILTNFPTIRATTRRRLTYYLKNLAYRLVIYLALVRSKKIITVSSFTKEDIISKFGVDSRKIVVIYEGVANLSKGLDSLFVAKLNNYEILNQYNIPDNFLLYVGNAYPHKNLERLLRVFSRLYAIRPSVRLVLVGRSDYFYERIKSVASSLNLWQPFNRNSPVIFPGYVPDAQLKIFYQAARAYVFPSLYEGFGLPPLEAMAQGCPVVSSDRASLKEILGEAAMFFNPEDEEDMLACMVEILTNPEKREALITKGREQSKKYHWWGCARETLDVYENILRS